ncbi:MAG: pantoate--beta-alanine ligase [Lysobacterales bacterium]
MQQARTREQLWSQIHPWRAAGQRIALVPTMGNLHDGHLALVEAARRHADRVITSLYVNPTQFGAGEDFARYPRTPEDDLQLLRAARCDLAFVPDDAAIYPLGVDGATLLRAAPALAGILEGVVRPGHFDGVVTVVARLLNLCAPDFAVFGEKDYQQLLVVRHMVEDLGYPLQILPVPTVREPGGLALSSRNRFLGASERAAANRLSAVLRDAASQVGQGGADHREVERVALERLQREGWRVDYVAVRRALDLGEPGRGDRDLRVLAAAWCGQTRLIDNCPATGPSPTAHPMAKV